MNGEPISMNDAMNEFLRFASWLLTDGGMMAVLAMLIGIQMSLWIARKFFFPHIDKALDEREKRKLDEDDEPQGFWDEKPKRGRWALGDDGEIEEVE